MATRQLPDAELLRKLLRYEPETGKLYWRERTPDMFKSGRHGPSSICKMWNMQHAGKEAFTAQSKDYCVGAITCGEVRWKLIAHRVIWCMVYGCWPERLDHINQSKADNRGIR